MLLLLNDLWQSQDFPDGWREATVIPIPKPGKDRTDPNNYRPIALTSCLCKIMERMINHRLTWFLQDNNIITKYQCGFQKGKSTTDHLVRLETYIRQGFVKNQHTVGVFFDLEKAYDTTWKGGIMKDLHEMGLKGRLPLFIDNFLKGRKFKVRLDNTHSSLNPQEGGVPQGITIFHLNFKLKKKFTKIKFSLKWPYWPKSEVKHFTYLLTYVSHKVVSFHQLYLPIYLFIYLLYLPLK